MKHIKNDFDLMTSMMIPVAVAINLTGFGLVKILNIPLFLDQIGTIFISLLAGPWVGIATALITNIIDGSLIDPVYLTFMPVALVLAFIVGTIGQFRMKNLVVKTIVTILAAVAVAIIVSAPIMVLYGGATGNATSVITATFLAAGKTIWNAVFSTTLFTETSDKTLSVLMAIFIIKSISKRYLIKFKYGENYINQKELSQ